MKNILKVLAVILAIAMMTVFATSCGSNSNKSKNTDSKISFDKSDDDDVEIDEDIDVEDDEDSSLLDSSSYKTAEDYLNSPTGQEEIETVKEMFDGTLDVEVYADGNEMYYDYAYLTTYDDETVETLKESLEESLETQASTFESLVGTMEEVVDGDITLTIIYRNGDSTILAERTYEN